MKKKLKKKLLFLLMTMLALVGASPSASAAFSTNTTYYADFSSCSWWNNSDAILIVWDGSSDVKATKVGSTGYWKFKVTNDASTIYLKRSSSAGEKWNEITVNSPSDSQNLIIGNSNFDGYSYSTYSVPAPYIYIDGKSNAFTKSGDNWIYSFEASSDTEFRLQNSDNTTALGVNVENVALCPNGATYNDTWTWSVGENDLSEYGNYSGRLKVEGGYKYTITIDNDLWNVTLASEAIVDQNPYTVSKVEIYNAANNSTGTFTDTDGTWTLTGFSPTAWATNSDDARYRIKVTLSNGSSEKSAEYTTKEADNANYWIQPNTTVDMVAATSGWFVFNNKDQGAVVNLTANFAEDGETLSSVTMSQSNPVLYLRGEWFNGWGADDNNKFTESNGVYTFTMPTGSQINANSSWKIGSENWSYSVGSFSSTTLENLSGEINAAGSNFVCTSDIPAGAVITYNIIDNSLKISAPLTITKVEIYNNYTTSDVKEFTLQDDGTYYLANFQPQDWAENNNGQSSVWTSTQYRIRVTLSDGTTTLYTAAEKDNATYWITGSQYDMVVAGEGWMMFPESNGVKNITLTFEGTTLKTLSTANREVTAAEYVNMPLKRTDFAGGKAHYFLVGFRTAAWRLQPEWELQKQDDGTYALPALKRLMYSQRFGIAKVDSYDDYINQRFTLYYADQVIKDLSGSVTLDANRSTSAHVAGQSGAGEMFTNENTLRWLAGWTGDDDIDENSIRWYTPVLLEKFAVTVNSGGEPTQLDYQANNSAAEINKHRTFSLVGDNIKPSTEITIGNETKEVTKFTHSYDMNGGIDGWANSWIQYDADGNPYVDATGHVLYQTAFDSDWLPNHPTQFDFTLDDGTFFPYESSEITFTNVANMSADELATDRYADLYNAHPNGTQADLSIGNTISSGNFNYTEHFNDPAGNMGDGNDGTTWIENSSSYNQSTWHCLVVKDAWMRGSFKIWSGWGGNLKYDEGGTSDNNMRWFLDNGGHGVPETEKGVKGAPVTGTDAVSQLYGTRMDVNGANFHITEDGIIGSTDPLVYYKRVILWYNEEQYGMNSAVLQFITEPLTPSIMATRSGKSTIGYRWNIPAVDGIDGSETVTRVAIVRRTLDGDKVVATKTVNANYEGGKTANELSDWQGFFYEENMAAGKYEYEISVWYDGEDTSKASIHTGLSNSVQILADAQPVRIKAEQRMEDGKYSFDLVITPSIRESLLERTSGDKSGLSMAKSIVITPDDATKAAINAARTIECTGWTNTDGTFTRDFNEDDMTLPVITIRDIAPNAGLTPTNDAEYTLTATLTCTDGDEEAWSALSYVNSTAAASIYAPTVTISLAEPQLVAVNTTEDRDDIANALAADDTAHWLLPAGSHTNDGALDNPAMYTLFNEVAATATIDELMIAQSVKDYWTVGYEFNVNNNSAKIENEYPTEITIHGLDINAEEVDDISGIAGDKRHQAADGANNASATVAVSYTRDGNTYSTPASDESSKSFTIDLGQPTFTVGKKTWLTQDYAESNNASVENNRTIARAQFDGTVGGICAGLNYYVGFNFTHQDMSQIVDDLGNLLAGGTPDGSFKGQQLYWGVINNRAAQGGRVIGRRTSEESKYVPSLGFDYLQATSYADRIAYISDWTVEKNSWSHAFKQTDNANRLPLEVTPIAVGEYKSDLTEAVAEVKLTGQISVVYPICQGITVTAEQTSTSVQAKVAQEASHTISVEGKLANIKALSAVANVDDITFTANDYVTGIETIDADSIDADTEIYNLQGIRVANPAPGNIYIFRRGIVTTKALYR